MTEVKLNENVRVVVRCRPMNVKEQSYGYFNVVNVKKRINTIEIVNPKYKALDGKSFTFDAVYDWNTSQEDLYSGSVQPVIDAVMNGFNGTILAYGQTGTGKTYTMEGNQINKLEKGVIPNTFYHIYNHISQSNNEQYLVRASYVEIYQEEVKDLLSEKSGKTYELLGDESGIYIKGLKSHICKNAKEMEAVMKYGKKNRKVGATDMNEHSSRSHAIFIITIEMSKSISGINHIVVGKLNLVDLAGSERQTKTCTSGERLKEASKINLSLSALGNVVSALSTGKNLHVPYRDSKLTRLLQDSLGGNSKTLMIANIGPASYNYEESLTTLRYANRAKNIKNKPVINEDPKDALIRQHQEEIERLKALLQSKLAKNEKQKLLRHNTKTDIECRKRLQNDKTITDSPCSVNHLAIASMSDDEKLKQLKVQTEQLNLVKKRSYIIELERHLYSIESRLLKGTNIEQHTQKQQDILNNQRDTLKKTTIRKLKLELKLGRELEATEVLNKSQTNLQQDIENKIIQINNLYCEIQKVIEETKEKVEDFNTDRNIVELTQRDLIKEYKLNQIIIDNFIPIYYKNYFISKAYYDESNETWKINYTKDMTYLQLANIMGDEKYRSETQGSILYDNIKNLKSSNSISSQNTSEYKSLTVPSILKCLMDNTLDTTEEQHSGCG